MENTVIGGVIAVMIAVIVIFVASRKGAKKTDSDKAS